MEFSVRERPEVRITPADVGKRVSVRRHAEPAGRSADEPVVQSADRSPDTSAGFTDVVGVLTSWTGGVLMITRRTGEAVRVPEPSLVAGKVVPTAPARRRGVPAASFAELAHVSSRAWQPVESEALGEWVLRAAAGFTRRANSALPLGDPGIPLDDALGRVRDWYALRRLPAYVQAATGAEGTQERLCAELAERGWERVVSAELRIGGLAQVGDLDADAARVRLTRSLDEPWLKRYQRFTVPGPHVRKVLGSGPSVWFATIPGESDIPAAIGRCVVDGRWAGVMAVEVDPERRRQGLAKAVMAALARRALDEGASAAWLQVESGNEGARALYEGMGFTVHHLYHHFRYSRSS
ncbi:GNAT family N-acetyltransferase [Streptomyces pacificus]|uniref:N-acetyltransferase n=1 Tax=Streptomyces pacificus TaxID=2705029 RepID=A0A6A0AZI8_9ACTN|nr:GNAT family N-acetyltransferase [Streptomyces pacificus]GFH37741.1 N-acetyltransferase [Streptomyces pacificus]